MYSCLSSLSQPIRPSAPDQGSERLLRADVSGLDVLVAEALDFVMSLFLIETDLGRSHNFTGALARGIELHLKVAERVVSGASTAIQLDKRHVARGNNSDDCVWSLLAFARDSDLIAGGTHCVDAALILFSKARRRTSGP